ncbi:DNA translocase FtsK 4TM domain-containing protein [Sphingopyxis sp. DHUNG17]|jgi:S-DNA-T family DNA segregation ATPase FtsK/SpoIIIE|uniref:FtsK/SpoIIIE family DNA translocase n=1 Tax=Sphingopyxis jiangsuensis TaxID=2871171 RepID=UPI00191DD301|nr:DNA translocase FtsK 4TM domain-containing protein [Sphingopyxis lutea]MBL0769348.1 DNA translocase FtsK 4TM domain-containing protein [Sphingopyxis lutea]
MASRRAASTKADWRSVFKASIARSLVIAAAALLGAFTLFLTLALVTYDSTDSALNTAAGGDAANWMGRAGAWFADLGLSIAGAPVVLLLPLLGILAWRLWKGDPQPYWKRQLAYSLAGILLIGLGAELWAPASTAAMPAGWGGIIALIVGGAITPLFERAGDPAAALIRIGTILALAGIGFWLAWRALRLEKGWAQRLRLPAAEASRVVEPAAPAAADDTPRAPNLMERVIRPRPRAEPSDRAPPEIADPVERSAPSKPKSKPQSELFANYQLPSIDLLAPAPERPAGQIDKAALERNARLLESVLEDFQVKGVITAVRPGPVVTMYELEPAPGTKASRVSNLADDIARNMSALSARIAPIPGRTVIGIELPNAKREAVVLHEIIGSSLFHDQSGALPIILGKNISGDAVIADLAPMPHLLIAGTTGSGKSVGLNAMILSLLYRLGPDQVKLIMIDPKMLELSVYDDIPHLLAPVVTEPKKAIRALKWAVEQMEDRYRMMSSLSVRNLASYNDKVRAALAKGKSLGRRVQTGYDPETGQPVYEEETLDYAPLPQIVIVVDELADLMMTAGKEVEFLIQRLAQKARAAGIHLILATQRPSVDVITGVIKANLPTRISFNVTSKIDSRTILGEAGAEQLLGKGDMLYVPGGKQITRIHGPFVSDDEVRKVADHWRGQGRPDYVESVTEDPEDGGFAMEGAPAGGDSAEDRMYAKACQIVVESQKASTSWLQRQLRIGYNSAARLIERMEEEGLVSPPNHVGRRDVLTDQYGQPR